MNQILSKKHVVVIGGGPAGLMAAEVIAEAGFSVSIYDAMPSLGRKFLLAGVGGMNITHSEAHKKLLSRYVDATSFLTPFLNHFSANDLREWIHGLSIKTFVGSSGRVFPTDMKAAPLLRAWLHRLRELQVTIFPRHRWLGWTESGALRVAEIIKGEVKESHTHADAVVLALGGASWPRLGSDGSWVDILRNNNIDINPLLPSNCGFEVSWSNRFQHDFAGAPLQTISLNVVDVAGQTHVVRGEAMVAKTGIEGTSVYALSAPLRELIRANGTARLSIDLLPNLSIEKISALLAKPRGKNSMSNFLRKQLNMSPIKLSLLRELTDAAVWQDNQSLSQTIKSLPLVLTGYRPIAEAISSAGGVSTNELTSQLMLKKIPGIFCAGEMLDWEAPTGGYLLTACFATGRAAGLGVVDYLTSTL